MADNYNRVIKYIVTMKCNSVLHIGASSGDKEEILVHPVTFTPFVQATTIAGMMRGCTKEVYGEKIEKKIFEGSKGSNIKISDGTFKDKKVKMEIRPHVKIDRTTGSTSKGQKFDMEYIGRDSKFVYCCYLFLNESNEIMESQIENIFAVLKQGETKIGGKKSTGAGSVGLDKLEKIDFDLKTAEGRSRWFDEEELESGDNITSKLATDNKTIYAYRIRLKAKTEGPMLVKSIYAEGFGENDHAEVNIRDSKDEYIVPGSSIKGSIRSQMEKISEYLHKESLIDEAFGKGGEKNDEGRKGNLYFFDTIVGDSKKNEDNPIRHRIHIDKFTGGVINQGLFSERNINGDLELIIEISKYNSYEAILGLLLMALRDLSIHTMSLGSGYSVGKGFLDVDNIIIKNAEGKQAEVSFVDNKIADSDDIIANALKALKEVAS
ncbi:MAG: hypothetical protein K6G11_06090 [Lachnospiraceae bacterium]|nr:hypothetical protein [Lachnospiraceae bacterium]